MISGFELDHMGIIFCGWVKV